MNKIFWSLLVPFLLLNVVTIAKETTLAEAIKAVDENVKTPEGKSYDSQSGRYFGSNYGPTIQSCVEKSKGDNRAFDVFARIASNGKVQEVLLNPATKVSTCLRPILLKDTFPKPPSPHYWINIHLSIE